MKLFSSAVIAVMLLDLCASGQGVRGQARESQERLHITRAIPQTKGEVRLAAMEIYRDLDEKGAESMLRLSGDVEVRIVSCGPTGQASKQSCLEPPVVMHADSVEYNEKTGKIQPTGNVYFLPEPSK